MWIANFLNVDSFFQTLSFIDFNIIFPIIVIKILKFEIDEENRIVFDNDSIYTIAILAMFQSKKTKS